jgi:hypothetical protein
MAGTTRVACTCDHAYQDEKYGKKIRVHNIKQDPSKGSTCTVCGSHKLASAAKDKK